MDATADDWLTGSDDGGENSGISDFGQRLREGASDWGNRMQERAASRRENSKNLARLAEDGAADKGSAAGNKGAGNSAFTSAVNNAKDAENKDGFANNVQGKTLEDVASRSMPGGRMIVNQAKKLGPLGTILIVVMAIVGVFAGSQSLAPFGLVANGLDQFNNLRTSMNRRSNYFMRFSMDRTRNHPITSKASIFGPEKFKISTGMSKKLSKNDITYIDSSDFEARFLIYKDKETNKYYAVVANDEDVGKIPRSADVDFNGQKVHYDFDDCIKIDDAMKMSDSFSKDLDKSTRTIKGHIAGWFDDVSKNLHDRLGSSRNKFRDAPDDADDDDIKKRARRAEDGGTDVGLDETVKESDSEAAYEKTHEELDDDLNRHIVDDGPEHINTEGDGMKKNATTAEISQALEKKTQAVIGAMGAGVDIYCTVMKAYSMLNVLVAGIMVANIVNYITGFLEAVQKTQTGDAGKTELSYYMTGLSQKGATKDMHGEIIPGKENTSSLESPAWNQFFSSGGLIVSNSDKAAQKFNRDTAFSMALDQGDGVMTEILSSGYSFVNHGYSAIQAYKNCLTAQAAAAGASLVVTVVVAFISMGIGAFIKDWAQNLLRDFMMGVVQAAIMGAFMLAIPYIAQWLAIDLISNMAGEDAAYAINSGFNIYAGRQMQASSGLPATKDKLMAHWRNQYDVIAEEGAYERSQRSPFDPTSKYTFVGSIVNSLMPIANTMSSPLTTISKTMNTVGVYTSSLLPTAKADGEVRFETSLNEECPTLKEIGLVGDAYCNPYFVTDFSTMAKDPAEVFAIVAGDTTEALKDLETGEESIGSNDNFIWDNVDDAEHNGNPDINMKSKLGKWVLSCAVRDSQFGQVDSNVMNAIGTLINTGSGGLDTALEFGIGLLPFVGDAEQIASAAKEGANVDWATGENCIKEEYKYYSRYSEDQRMMESAGIIKQSAVAKLLEEYYKENPIDNSYEGTIARYSGLTKDQVAETIQGIEIAQWLAEYNPENYGPMKFESKGDGSYQYESDELVANAEKAVVGSYIVFDDLRTKTKIA